MSIATTERKDVPVQVFQQMDRLDENQILAEMRGELIEEFVYSIQLGGKEVTNLSYAGVKEAIRRRGQVEQLEVRGFEDEKEYHALVRLRDLTSRVDVLGAASAEKNKPFAYVLAFNKAERNAFAKLIPAKLIAALIHEYTERMKPKPVGQKSVPESSVAKEGVKAQPESPPRSVQEGTKPSLDSPVPREKEPVQNGLSHVPLILNELPPSYILAGVEQTRLTHNLDLFGVINQLGNELAIIPAKPLDQNIPALRWFIQGTASKVGVVSPICAKYRLTWEARLNEKGLLEAVLISGGKLEAKQIEELKKGAEWAFSRALQEEPKK